MEAQRILTATHELEDTGMTRSQSEAIAKTIVAAVEPLATKADMESLKEQMMTKADLESGIKSLKIWLLLILLLGVHGSLLAIVASIAFTFT